MEIIGKVIQVLPIKEGTSKTSGNKWQSLSFIIETIENYPRKIALELYGKDRIKNNPVMVGQTYNISADIESREFNGNWYTSVRAWKVEAQQNQQSIPTETAPTEAPTSAPSAPAAPSFPPQGAMPTDDLPF